MKAPSDRRVLPSLVLLFMLGIGCAPPGQYVGPPPGYYQPQPLVWQPTRIGQTDTMTLAPAGTVPPPGPSRWQQDQDEYERNRRLIEQWKRSQ